MSEVKERALGDPQKHGPKIKAVDDRLERCVKYAEGESVDSAHGGVDRHAKPRGHLFRQEHSHRPQDRPQVKVRHPPCVKSRISPLEKCVDINVDV